MVMGQRLRWDCVCVIVVHGQYRVATRLSTKATRARKYPDHVLRLRLNKLRSRRTGANIDGVRYVTEDWATLLMP